MAGKQSRFSSRLSRPDLDTTYELQLKGAGRTPFSGSANDLTVLRSSIVSIYAQKPSYTFIAVTGAKMPVLRERLEKACTTTRVAETLIRIGNFEAFSPSRAIFFFGGGQRHADYKAPGIFGEWTAMDVPKLDNVNLDAGDA
ncbi:hypothetical protein EDD15DRAFT_2441309 [Pisolithus albus]|nr:hypothetical protein EDD15DRAFT_2441309 [Pisolithus albus]